MESSHYTAEQPQDAQLFWITSEVAMRPTADALKPGPQTRWPQLRLGFLDPIRQWLEAVDVRDRKIAQTLCSVIPAQCPFERSVQLFGRTILYIPPLCKLNPFYEQLVGLRFRALCYLADECGEDISPYC